MAMIYWTEDMPWEDVQTDMGIIRRRKPIKISNEELEVPKLEEKPKVVEDSEATAKLKKELNLLQKKFEAQTNLIKNLMPQINTLEELHRDALLRMEADTLDDVYGMGQITAEFNKLKSNMDKYIPKDLRHIENEQTDRYKAEYEAAYQRYLARNPIR